MTAPSQAPWTSAAAVPQPPDPRLDETLFPPLSTVELVRTPDTDYLGRFMESAPHEAEVFHVNSRISRISATNRPLDRELMAATHDWARQTGFVPRPGDIRAGAASAGAILQPPDLDARLGPFVGALAELGDPWWFALDRYLLLDAGLYQLGGGRLWAERLTGPGEHEQVTGTFHGLHGGPALAHLLLVGAPWRYLMLQGPRGYRRLLVDTGRALAQLDRLGADTGVDTTATLDFEDTRLEQQLRLDGLEHTVLAVIRLDGADQ